MKEKLFKCLEEGRIGPFSRFRWPKCGVWVKAEGELSVCENGIHLCRKQDLTNWLNDEIYEAEYRGHERLNSDDKIIVREARLKKKLKTWHEKTAALFACDCAEHVLPIYEAKFPDDKWSREAIEVARRYANGKATQEELKKARDAAWTARDAARAAWDATWGAARAAWTARDAARIAGDAAWTARDAARAAKDAAWDAARVAWDAECKWQTKRLMQYLYPREKR
jgi:hypothetical protein